VLCRRETCCGKLTGQGDKGGHQQNVQAHNAEVQLKQARLGDDFAEAAFDHPGFTVQDMVFTVRHNPQRECDPDGCQHGYHPEQGVQAE